MTEVIDESSVEVGFGVDVTLGHQKGRGQSDRSMVLKNIQHHLLHHLLNQWYLGGELTLSFKKSEFNGHFTRKLRSFLSTVIVHV